MKNYFDGIKVGDRVFNQAKGWGTVTELNNALGYQVVVHLDYGNEENRADYFTLSGRSNETDLYQSWFWSEVVIVAPPKPKMIVQKKARGFISEHLRSTPLIFSFRIEDGDIPKNLQTAATLIWEEVE